MMFSEEVKQTVYLAVTCCLLAVVLSFAAVFIGLRNDMAQVRNEQIITTRSQRQSNEFSQYDGKEVTGAEVIQAIRDYYKSEDVCIYVKKSGSYHFYSYKSDREGIYSEAFPTLSAVDLDNKYKLDSLQDSFNASKKYTAYTLYGFPVFSPGYANIINELTAGFSKYRNTDISTDITAIYFVEE